MGTCASRSAQQPINPPPGRSDRAAASKPADIVYQIGGIKVETAHRGSADEMTVLRQHLKNLFPDRLTVREVEEGSAICHNIMAGHHGHREQPISPAIMFPSGTGNRTPV